MATPIRPLNNRSRPTSLQQMQSVGDGQSNPGPGPRAAAAMQGELDAQTAGGLRPDTSAKFAHLPEPMRTLIGKTIGDGDSGVV